MLKFLAIALAMAAPGEVFAAESVTEDIPFEDCLYAIQEAATEFKIAPIDIVETDILRIVRFPTGDGSVEVTCSKLDNELIITESEE